MEGCDVVFHCAYGNTGTVELKRRINVEGSENVFKVALEKGVRRVVYLSTQVVYGLLDDGVLDETAPLVYTKNEYADTKVDAEKLARDYFERHKLPVVILQPTAVYGPFAPAWGANVIERMKRQRVILLNGGDGVCNAVYIDDLIEAMLLSAIAPERALGQAFLISGARPVSWREFYGAFEKILGGPRTVVMSTAEAEAYLAEKEREAAPKSLFKMVRSDQDFRRLIRNSREVSALKSALQQLPAAVKNGLKRVVKGPPKPQVAATPGAYTTTTPEDPVEKAGAFAIQLYRSKAVVAIDKARDLLGYDPQYEFDEGMRLTEAWARWARLC
jgi:nucleoside-diphosphate-sugar epimerase